VGMVITGGTSVLLPPLVGQGQRGRLSYWPTSLKPPSPSVSGYSTAWSSQNDWIPRCWR
jgi:hypothetical protein